MNSKILVSGATGTIGSFVVDILTRRKADFIALVRTEGKAKPFNEKGIETRIGDFADEASLAHALDGIHRLFLLSVTSPDSTRLQGNMIRAAKQAGVKRMVKLSVRGADTRASFNIGKWHGEVEAMIRETGIPFTFLRPHSFMQNFLFDAQSIREKGLLFSAQGDGKIPYVDARDIAAVAARALTEDTHEGKTYVLTGPEALSYEEIAGYFTSLLKRKISYQRQSAQEAQKAMMEAGMPAWLVDDMMLLNESYSSNQAAEVSPDVEHVLGRKAHSFEEFLQDYLDYFK